ncbi:hypothetical protein [Alloscardovia omnicolens]|uniref:hypothetical protein n=1 Tax=Alloscardovia omnicolens TaxID=419015 RepID=UPI003A60850B
MAGSKTKRRKLERKYVIRRAIALLIAAALLIAGGWGIYVFVASRSVKSTASSQTLQKSSKKKSSPAQKANAEGVFRSQRAQDSGISDCTISNVAVKLVADTTDITTNGTVNFRKDFTHSGTLDCILNVSDDSMALVVSNSEGVQVYRSDACEVSSSVILLGQNDTYQKSTSWSAAVSNVAVNDSLKSSATVNGNGHGCMKEGESAPHVAPGEYTAQLINIADDTMKSEPVKITVKAEPQPQPEQKDDQQQVAQ